MLEFEEFLKILASGQKGGGGGHTDAEKKKDSEASGAIFKFFKDLSTDKLNKDKDYVVPFPLYIATERRRKIL